MTGNRLGRLHGGQEHGLGWCKNSGGLLLCLISVGDIDRSFCPGNLTFNALSALETCITFRFIVEAFSFQTYNKLNSPSTFVLCSQGSQIKQNVHQLIEPRHQPDIRYSSFINQQSILFGWLTNHRSENENEKKAGASHLILTQKINFGHLHLSQRWIRCRYML